MALKKYVFTTRYHSGAGTWTKGQEIDVDEDTAAWFNRDVPGCLEEVKPEKKVDTVIAERTLESPPADRQVKTPEAKRGEGAMTKADVKATKDKT